MSSKKYLKSDLVAELAEIADVPKIKVDTILNELAQIAYREASKGFFVPGICKLDVTRRKARRVRLPGTGQWVIIGEHKALRVRPLKKAKHAVAPMMPGLVQFVTPEEASAAAPKADTAAPAAPAAGAQPYNPEGLVSFKCGACGQEIEAPFDMAGTRSECPACGGRIEVPYISEPGTIWGRVAPDHKPPALMAHPALPAQPAIPVEPAEPALPAGTNAQHEAAKGRTIRINLPDDVV